MHNSILELQRMNTQECYEIKACISAVFEAYYRK